MERRIPGYHSDTPYSFPAFQSSEIVRTCAYHRRDHDLAVIWFPPREHIAVGELHASTSPSTQPTTALGDLDNLPLELLQNIILQLDMASLFRFRHTSARAMQAVDSLREYNIITSHALNVYCALMRTHLASRILLSDFYQLLCTNQCAFCSSFGNLVHLPTWVRCCSRCLESRSSPLRTTSLAALKRTFKLSKTILANLPKFKNLTGIYTMDEVRYLSQIWLVSIECFVQVYRQEHPGVDLTGQILNEFQSKHAWKYMSCCAIPSYSPRNNKTHPGISCAGCQLAVEVNNVAGYADRMRVYAYRDEIHSTESFLRHFTWCQQAQHMWISSNDGTMTPASLPEACRRRGFFKPREQ